MSIQALREQLSQENRSAKALLESKGDRPWTKEEQGTFDKHMDAADSLNAQIKAHQRMIDAEAEANFQDAAKQASKGSKTGDIDALDAVALYMRHGANVNAEQATAIRNAMSTTTNSEGGFTVPSQVAAMVIDALKAFGGMREVATVIRTDNGQAWSYPSSDGTAEVGEIVGENAAANTGEITFGSVPLVVYKYSSKKIALPWELIQDSAIDVVGFVVNRLAQRLGRIQNTHQTVGTGSGQPFGLIARASIGKTGATSTTVTVTHDDLVDLVHSVNRAYRGGAGFMMADSSVRVIRKLKDTTGRPIYTPGYEAGITQGVPDSLLGYPLTVNDDVAAMSANAKSIAFGQLSQYVIRDVSDVQIRRFDDSAFALNGQVGFCGWARTGGNLMDTAAVKVFVNSAT